MPKYLCPCGYEQTTKSAMKKHLQRKKSCVPGKDMTKVDVDSLVVTPVVTPMVTKTQSSDKTLADIIAFKDKMLTNLSPMEETKYQEELTLTKNLIKYVELRDNTDMLKPVVKFYKAYLDRHSEDKTALVLNELIIFLLLKRFNCSLETREEFKKHYPVIKSLFTS
jgi:hypothetical protein